MEKEFSIELNELEAEFLNTLMPNGHSVQIFEKYERRKKAEKKLDDMYVAEFSLRPVKKVKKENEHQNIKNEHNPITTGKTQSKDSERQKSNNNNLAKEEKHHNVQEKSTTNLESKSNHQLSRHKQEEEIKYRSSRSQRVSRPTEAYLQFQEDTFKRKFVDKEEPKQSKDENVGLKEFIEINDEVKKNDNEKKVGPLVELKSIIAKKMEKQVPINKEFMENIHPIETFYPHYEHEQENNKPIKENNFIDSRSKNFDIENKNLINSQLNKSNTNETIKPHQQNEEHFHAETISSKRSTHLREEPKLESISHNIEPKHNNNNNNLLLTVLSENFVELQEMPQTRRAQQKLTEEHNQDSLSNEMGVIKNNKELVLDEKPHCESSSKKSNDIDIINVNSPNKNKKATNESPVKLPSSIRVKYNLSEKKEQNNNNNKELTRAWRILYQLKTHKSSWPFRYPVDPISQGVPDYLEKISHPMDLKTIERKLKSEKYLSEEQFFDDVELMLRNSYEYNPKSSVYYKLTVELEGVFNELKSKGYVAGKSLSGTRKGSGSGNNNRVGNGSNDDDNIGSEEEEENSDSYIRSDEEEEEEMEEQQEEQQKEEKSHWEGMSNNKSTNNNEPITKFSSTISKRERELYEMEKYKLLEKRLRPMGKKVVVTNDGEGRRVESSSSELIKKEGKSSSSELIKKERKSVVLVNNINDNNNSNTNSDNNNNNNNKKYEEQHEKETIINTNNTNNNNNINKRIGYTTCYEWQQENHPLLLINREHLLYDILHLQEEQSKESLYQFIMNNELLKKQLLVVNYERDQEEDEKEEKRKRMKVCGDNEMVIREEEQQQSKEQSKELEHECEEIEEKEFELSNLDIHSYKLLRTQVDKLIKLEEEHEQQQINTLYKENNNTSIINENVDSSKGQLLGEIQEHKVEQEEEKEEEQEKEQEQEEKEVEVEN